MRARPRLGHLGLRLIGERAGQRLQHPAVRHHCGAGRRLLNGLGKRPQVTLESGQSLNQCAEGPFSIFRIAAVGPESIDKRLLAFNNATGFGNTAFGRKKRIVGAFCPSHKVISPDGRKVS